MTTLANGGAVQPASVYTGSIPAEGRQAIPFNADFTAGTTINVDFSALGTMQRRISMIQTVYIDNSQNTANVVLSVAATGQSIACPAGAQGFFPLLMTSQMSCSLFSTGNLVVPVFFLNFAVAPAVWGATGINQYNGAGYLLVSDPAIEAVIAGSQLQVTQSGNRIWNDASGTIAVGGTSQVALAANAARSRYRIFNPDAAETLYVNDVGAAAVVGAGIPILAGRSYTPNPGDVSTSAIAVIAATAAHKFSLYWV